MIAISVKSFSKRLSPLWAGILLLVFTFGVASIFAYIVPDLIQESNSDRDIIWSNSTHDLSSDCNKDIEFPFNGFKIDNPSEVENITIEVSYGYNSSSEKFVCSFSKLSRRGDRN